MKNQKGAVPVIVIIALVAAFVGGLVGFQLGDGTFFSFGVGFGMVFFAWIFIEPFWKKLKKAAGINGDENG